MKVNYLVFLFVSFFSLCSGSVELGVDVFFSDKAYEGLKGKKVGLITNHTGVSQNLKLTYELFLQRSEDVNLTAIFSPEHGLFGREFAAKKCKNQKIRKSIPVHSLYGDTRRPTSQMLEGIDVLIYDIQDVGTRTYTYATTLFYVMEEAAKKGIEVWVLDRPNPLGGLIVDGPLLETGTRSFTGYVDVPFCHGMTIGELAQYFRGEHCKECLLKVVKMKGWTRSMFYKDTGLSWVPTSPYIPEADTPLFYATTGLIGELSFLSIGIGYTLPFKVIGAPWINGKALCEKMNQLGIPGAHFLPFHFTPLYGLYKGENCEGFLIVILDRELYKPVRVQHYILGVVKAMYPDKVEQRLQSLSKAKKKMFCDAAGGSQILSIFLNEKYPASKLVQFQADKRREYIQKRKKYLLYN